MVKDSNNKNLKKADLILKNGRIITIDSKDRIFRNGTIIIDKGKIIDMKWK